MKTKTKRKAAVPPILPRERLTHKAFEAISQYATHRAKKHGLYIQHFMVRYVLEAERMRRSDLYAWLEEKGYQWSPAHDLWFARDGSGEQVVKKTVKETNQ